ncbi:Hypothetical protein NTJ_15171 [Nesidiocoris tenuis]|uniref:Uncharacterized protein n=1 Tax=Nesidiocoris tenuis TaxID=355587 RepID=A0ABN7BDE7_9HEMI|nr:Hypothetical protein NTJ_15171 [Nesidiocoris tenuis]
MHRFPYDLNGTPIFFRFNSAFFSVFPKISTGISCFSRKSLFRSIGLPQLTEQASFINGIRRLSRLSELSAMES